MPQMKLRQMLEFDRLTELRDRLVYLILDRFAGQGHGDWSSCGVAELDLIELAEACDEPPGEMLRRLRRVATAVDAVCVEHENTVLVALAGAAQDGFDHIYKRCGFTGLPPNLPRATRRTNRI